MRRKLCVILAFALIIAIMPVLPAHAQQNTVNANTAAELENAIDSDTTIILGAHTYTFSDGLWVDEIENLTIVGTEGTKIISRFSHEGAIGIFSSRNIRISGVAFGFDLPASSVGAGVISVFVSEDVVLDNCVFTGGVAGFEVFYSSATFSNCTFRNSNSFIGEIGDSEVTFNNCTFRDNGARNAPGTESSSLRVSDSPWHGETPQVIFNRCTFWSNNNTSFKNEITIGVSGIQSETIGGENSYSTGRTRVNNSIFTGNGWQTGVNARAIRVFLDGRQMDFDVPPMLVGNRVLVPLRTIFEEMGAIVTWEQSTRTATATKGDTVVVLTIGNTSPTVNGKVVPIDQPGIILNNRTLAPARFVAEAFGGAIDWDGPTRTATITTSPNGNNQAGIDPA